jgi:hypothetical protein
MAKPCKGALLAACAVLCLPYIANAATVANHGGIVLVSRGEGFTPIANDTDVATGALVMVKPGGLAKITYSYECAVRVGPGVWQVQPAAPCAKGTAEIDFTGRMNDGMVTTPTEPEPAPAPAMGGTWLLIGAAVVGGGLLIACVADWCRSSKSSSP